MSRKTRLSCALLVVVFALAAAAPTVAGRGEKDGLKFSVEVLAW